MRKNNIDNNKVNLKSNFIKLGFDEKKSLVARFDKNRIKLKLEQIELPKCGSIPLTTMKLNEVKKETKKTISTLYQGVNLKVDIFEYEIQTPVLPIVKEISKKAKALIMAYEFGHKSLNDITDEILMFYKRNSKKVNVFDVPITEVEDENSMQGQIVKGPLIIVGNAERMLKKTPIFVETIFLGNKYDKLSIGTYIHEITHALIDRHKGVVENYYNDELLSIFMEKVAIDHIDTSSDKFLVKCSETYRLANVKESLKEIDTYKNESEENKECLKYIQSSLYAGVLFDRYSKAESNKKREMLEQVKTILNGKSKLSDFIEEQQLSIEDDEVFAYIDKVEKYARDLKKRRKTDLDFEVSEMSTEKMQIKAIKNGNKIASDLIPQESIQEKD